MECLTEFTCSVFVDGEFPEHELREVEGHLGTCAACRGMVAAYREESRLLVHFVQEIDLVESGPAMVSAPQRVAQPASRPASPKDALKFGGFIVGVASLLELATSSPENFELPSIPVSLDWLDPSSLHGRLNWLLSTIAYLASEGTSRMMSIMDGLSVVVLFALMVAGAAVVIRRSVRSGAMAALVGRAGMVGTLGVIVLMVMASSTPSYAMDIRNVGKDKVAMISAGETVNDSVLATGDTVIVDGTINGDLFAFARQVTVHGTVKGNIVTGAQSIDLSGNVDGSIFAAGQTIQINGHVARNVAGFSQSTTIGKNSVVDGNVVTGGNEAHINGAITRDFFAFGFADIAGTVGRNVLFRGAKLSVLPTARIAGDVEAHAPRAESVLVDPGAVIGGKQTTEVPKPAPSKYSTLSFYFGQVLHVAAAFIVGMILLFLFPGVRRTGFSGIGTILKSGGVGFLAMVAMPIASFILLITLIGIPVALTGFFTWILGLYLAKIIVASFIGRTLLASSGDRMASVALGLLVGLVSVFVVINLPVIGGLVHFILLLVGFGSLILTAFESFRSPLGSEK